MYFGGLRVALVDFLTRRDRWSKVMSRLPRGALIETSSAGYVKESKSMLRFEFMSAPGHLCCWSPVLSVNSQNCVP